MYLAQQSVISSNVAQQRLEREISLTLTFLGIMPSLKGHLVIKRKLLKRIELAKNCDPRYYNTEICTKADAANIRNALQVASISGKLQSLNQLLGADVIAECGYFSPKQIMALLENHFIYLDDREYPITGPRDLVYI